MLTRLEKQDASPISELASSIFELAFSNSELTSSISEIPSRADFYRGMQDVQSILEFLPVETPFLHFYDLDLSDLFFLQHL